MLIVTVAQIAMLSIPQEINAHGQTVLCRTENYVNFHAGLNSVLRGQKLLSLLKQLSGEDMLLFKEKINYKLAGSGRSEVEWLSWYFA
jgi:hypothetical protein